VHPSVSAARKAASTCLRWWRSRATWTMLTAS